MIVMFTVIVHRIIGLSELLMIIALNVQIMSILLETYHKNAIYTT